MLRNSKEIVEQVMITKKEPAKEAIKRSLCELILVKPYDDITVTDLVRNAQVARVTFYRLFRGIDDVLNCVVEDCYDLAQRDIFPYLLSGEIERLERPICDLMVGMKEAGDQNSVMRALNVAIAVGKFEEVVYARLRDKILDKAREYKIIYQCGIIISLLHAWIYTGYIETPEEMTAVILEALDKTR